ncbi:hypothetical protein [Candidatus Formimonas warabiya]|uniref:Uncharacterized protein n=1 Tax=Formimonas warabiya TaxID=1761012 RepID=A0A3G1KV63_FORW1|nr:hypothetical protein [Candidatus Formimonas warabiya]ATW26326.1 hypothetical protein DCMF_17545 [Candidatus Formimonas warabiya]
MKKLTFLISLVCLLMLFTGAVYAMDTPKSNDLVVIEKAEITDINQLLSRAKNGKSDLNVQPFIKKQNVFLESHGNSKKLESFTTAQVLKEIKKKDGSTEKTVAVTTFVEIKSSDFSIQGTGHYDDEDGDSTGSVLAYSTVYWNTVTDSLDNTGYLLTKVNGGWQIQDAQVSLSNRTVQYYCSGMTIDSGPSVKQKYTQTPTANAYAYNTGFTKYVVKWQGSASIGMTSTVKLTRGTANWNFSFTNDHIE